MEGRSPSRRNLAEFAVFLSDVKLGTISLMISRQLVIPIRTLVVNNLKERYDAVG
jgi:hypothetical protein